MDTCEVLVIVTFVMVAIIMISQYIDSNVPKVRDVLQLMNVLQCHEIRAYKSGRRMRTIELIDYINSPVKSHEMKDGILYIAI